MATWNGKEYDLEFACGSCGLAEKIRIDLDNAADKEKLWSWLQTHSAGGGEYKNVSHPCQHKGLARIGETKVYACQKCKAQIPMSI